MILFLSKFLPLFIFPLGLALSLLLVTGLLALVKFKRPAAWTAGAATILLWVCSTPIFANWTMASLERHYPAQTVSETQYADAAIVLGGALGQPSPPRVEVGLSEASSRVLHAARLYRAGKVKLILVSAGNIPWLPAVKPEAELVKELLVEWGVPAGAIELGGESRNTYENAIEMKQIWQKKGFTSALLVTSAAHMPRALATFRRAGLPVYPSTTDVRTVDAGTPSFPFDWVPNAQALVTTTNALKEWTGLLAYKLLGYA